MRTWLGHLKQLSWLASWVVTICYRTWLGCKRQHWILECHLFWSIHWDQVPVWFISCSHLNSTWQTIMPFGQLIVHDLSALWETPCWWCSTAQFMPAKMLATGHSTNHFCCLLRPKCTIRSVVHNSLSHWTSWWLMPIMLSLWASSHPALACPPDLYVSIYHKWSIEWCWCQACGRPHSLHCMPTLCCMSLYMANELLNRK